MDAEEILKRLKAVSNPSAVAGMAKFGINPKNTYGVSIPVLRKMATEIGRNHALANDLWRSGVHEARILASMIEIPQKVTPAQMDRWANDFDSWDVCDQCCSNLFDKTEAAHQKASEWSGKEREFVKRAGFALMAALAVHDKKASDAQFLRFVADIKRGSVDDRNFVKKAVNWALRQIGKRNLRLNRAAVTAAREIRKLDSQGARWIAADALRELTSPRVQSKLKAK